MKRIVELQKVLDDMKEREKQFTKREEEVELREKESRDRQKQNRKTISILKRDLMEMEPEPKSRLAIRREIKARSEGKKILKF